jgi:hypothetical protein
MPPVNPHPTPSEPGTADGRAAGSAETPPSHGQRPRGWAKRAGHAIVIAIAVAFIGASAAQIIPAVFGLAGRPGTPAGPVVSRPDSPAAICSDGVRVLVLALDRASGQAWMAIGSSDGAAGTAPFLQTFERGLLPEWGEERRIAQACASSSEGLEAWAALLRLRRAEEQDLVHGQVELAALRRDVAAHLATDLR